MSFKNLVTVALATALGATAVAPASATEYFSLNYEEIKVTYNKCSVEVEGTDRDDLIVVTADDDGTVRVNGQIPLGWRKVPLEWCSIDVDGGAGNDLIIDHTGYATLDGGAGNDVLVLDDAGVLDAAQLEDGIWIEAGCEIERDLVVSTSSSAAEDDVVVDGPVITAQDYDSARSTATDDVWIDGNIITAENVAEDDVYVDGNLVTAQDWRPSGVLLGADDFASEQVYLTHSCDASSVDFD